jgi:hypothetical protein
MTDMSAFLQPHCDTGKHVDGAVLLYVAAVFDDDLPPVSADGGAGTDINSFTNDDIACNCGLWMNE